MLTQIYVKNFVLIDAVRLDFDSRMSVFTGETGAGKSLLIDAIGLLCGQRASAGYVKKGADRALIEGVFSLRQSSAVSSGRRWSISASVLAVKTRAPSS